MKEKINTRKESSTGLVPNLFKVPQLTCYLFIPQSQQYTVSVNDGDFEATALVLINILHSNDRPPEFTQTLYNYTVTELSTLTLDPSVS